MSGQLRGQRETEQIIRVKITIIDMVVVVVGSQLPQSQLPLGERVANLSLVIQRFKAVIN